MRTIVGVIVLLQVAAGLAAEFPNASKERRAAGAAEKRKDWDEALLHYERIYDSTPTDEKTRTELRGKFAELRPKVAPNTDLEKAGVWKVKAFAFRTVDFTWKDREQKEHHARYRLREDEVEGLRRAQQAFADRVWQYSSGNLRIAWDLTVVEEPLTKLDGESSFWPGPGSCLPYIANQIREGEADTIFVYAKVRAEAGKDEPSEDLPLALLGGALGVLAETRGSTYIGINMIGFKPSGGMVDGEPSGEAELHEWLHSVQWALEDYQGYPAGLMFTSDGGRREGEPGGDPCFRRKEGETSWVPYYAHLMQSHVTRKMWRELSPNRPVENVWISAYCREFLVLGPFSWDGKPNYGLDEPFIRESGATPLTAGRKSAGPNWQPARAAGRMLDLTEVYGTKDNHLAYLQVNARAKTRTTAQLRVGSDDGCKVWQNGNEVLVSSAPRACQPDQDVVDIKLQKGDNLFLLKVTNLAGGWGAIFRLTDREGNPLPDIQYTAPIKPGLN